MKVAALWWSQKEREICVTLVGLVVSSLKLLKQALEITLQMKVTFFQTPCLSAKCMPRNAVRCSILLVCWASLVKVFPIQKRYSHTLRAVFPLTLLPKWDRIEVMPSAWRFHGQWCSPQAPDSSWPQAPEKKILVWDYVGVSFSFLVQRLSQDFLFPEYTNPMLIFAFNSY